MSNQEQLSSNERVPDIADVIECLHYVESQSGYSELVQNCLAALDYLQRKLAQAKEQLAKSPHEEAPYAWVIPGDDNANMNGFIDARINCEGEFTKPLYARRSTYIAEIPTHEPKTDIAARIAEEFADEIDAADVETIMEGNLLARVVVFLRTGHLEACDTNDSNIEGIRKPCNCRPSLTKDCPACGGNDREGDES